MVSGMLQDMARMEALHNAGVVLMTPASFTSTSRHVKALAQSACKKRDRPAGMPLQADLQDMLRQKHAQRDNVNR